jgi:diacylglycerol kinase
MSKQKFSARKQVNSFKYAFRGLKILISEEHNSRIHLSIALLVILAGILFRISVFEWVAIIIAIGFVITLEIINSVVERISNYISPEYNDKIKGIKDLSAAGVLTGSITAVIIGLIIFIPKLIQLFKIESN